MPLIRTLLSMAARRAATDPRVHAKLAETASRLKPAAERTARAFRDAVRSAPPLEDPRRFARTLRDRLRGDS